MKDIITLISTIGGIITGLPAVISALIDKGFSPVHITLLGFAVLCFAAVIVRTVMAGKKKAKEEAPAIQVNVNQQQGGQQQGQVLKAPDFDRQDQESCRQCWKKISTFLETLQSEMVQNVKDVEKSLRTQISQNTRITNGIGDHIDEKFQDIINLVSQLVRRVKDYIYESRRGE